MKADQDAVRPPAVAGSFYPAPPRTLATLVAGFLDAARAVAAEAGRAAPAPKALLVPHAGYIYSGSTAAHGYARLDRVRHAIQRVVLLGPTHRVAVEGLALPTATAFATPLGEVPVELPSNDVLARLPQMVVSASAHAQEHSLEVQLPFLQSVLADFTLVPFAVGRATPEEVAQVLEALWGGPETLVVVSSDLSHYLPYAQAQAIDRDTVSRILGLDGPLRHDQACGATPANGLLVIAARRRMRAELIAMCNSGDTAGDKRQVVGYASVGFTPSGSEHADDHR